MVQCTCILAQTEQIFLGKKFYLAHHRHKTSLHIFLFRILLVCHILCSQVSDILFCFDKRKIVDHMHYTLKRRRID